jgi:3-oxoacyl-(acyl-carrier-protein) synthase
MPLLRRQMQTARSNDKLKLSLRRSQGHRKMNPFCIPFSILNMGGALLAMDLDFMGPNYPINTACATGNYCLLKCVCCPAAVNWKLERQGVKSICLCSMN